MCRISFQFLTGFSQTNNRSCFKLPRVASALLMFFMNFFLKLISNFFFHFLSLCLRWICLRLVQYWICQIMHWTFRFACFLSFPIFLVFRVKYLFFIFSTWMIFVINKTWKTDQSLLIRIRWLDSNNKMWIKTTPQFHQKISSSLNYWTEFTIPL